jgi:hypothetical protein
VTRIRNARRHRPFFLHRIRIWSTISRAGRTLQGPRRPCRAMSRIRRSWSIRGRATYSSRWRNKSGQPDRSHAEAGRVGVEDIQAAGRAVVSGERGRSIEARSKPTGRSRAGPRSAGRFEAGGGRGRAEGGRGGRFQARSDRFQAGGVAGAEQKEDARVEDSEATRPIGGGSKITVEATRFVKKMDQELHGVATCV